MKGNLKWLASKVIALLCFAPVVRNCGYEENMVKKQFPANIDTALKFKPTQLNLY